MGADHTLALYRACAAMLVVASLAVALAIVARHAPRPAGELPATQVVAR